jgi:hypothetical protein
MVKQVIEGMYLPFTKTTPNVMAVYKQQLILMLQQDMKCIKKMLAVANGK